MEQLREELEAAKIERHQHADLYQFQKKGKEPEQERPPSPLSRPLRDYKQTDQYLVSRPPPKWELPEPYPCPVGQMSDNTLFLGIKPILLQLPKVFKGEHNDIKRFFGDCLTYFKVFTSYFQCCPSLQVGFATSLFDGPAKDW